MDHDVDRGETEALIAAHRFVVGSSSSRTRCPVIKRLRARVVRTGKPITKADVVTTAREFNKGVVVSHARSTGRESGSDVVPTRRVVAVESNISGAVANHAESHTALKTGVGRGVAVSIGPSAVLQANAEKRVVRHCKCEVGKEGTVHNQSLTGRQLVVDRQPAMIVSIEQVRAGLVG